MSAPTIFCNECGASNPVQATICFACKEPLQPPAPLSHVQHQVASGNAAVLSVGTAGLLAPSYLLHARYDIVRQIGTGGFGAVYLAKDTLFSHRPVAIKEMSQDGLSPRELAEATTAFEREALFLADLTHPNLPRIHDHFSERGRSYVVMDFIAGDTLEDSLVKFGQRFSVEVALDIALQLSTVLDYLHTRQPPIIFRDLKPANIMRTLDNHVYLIDFGIARHFKPGKAKDTIPLGSRGYAAPEQYGKGQSTPQSDIYGLGATLHQLLTGEDPSLALFHFDPVRMRNSPISTNLNTLLKQMVAMEISKRPASMAVVKQELERLIARQVAQRLSSVRTLVGRRRFVSGLLSVVAVCGVSSAITAFVSERMYEIDPSTHPLVGNTPVIPPASAKSLPADTVLLNEPHYTYRGHDGLVTAVAWSPQGQYIASAGTIDGTVQVWDVGTGDIITISRFEFDPLRDNPRPAQRVSAIFVTGNQRVDGLAWSGDNTSVAAALGNDTVEVWGIKRGDASLLRFGEAGDANAIAWSPDGTRIAAVSGNTAIEVRSVATGDLFVTYKAHTQAVLAIAWSPDGKWIVSGGVDGTAQVWDATTGRLCVVYPVQVTGVNALAWSPDGKWIASGGSDSTVQVWDAATGRTLFTYHGHTGGVNAVAWARKGALLQPGQSLPIASAGADATVRVWSFGGARNTKSQQSMNLEGKSLIYLGHSGPVTSVTWAPDGKRIASGSEDGTVQIWQAT